MSGRQEAYIVDGIRTPIGKFRGTLSTVRPDDLLALTIRTLVERNDSIDPAVTDDVIMGCANQAGEDNRNVARMSLLLAGLPHTVPGETINRLCASGMSATVRAYHAIGSGNGSQFITGGVESMTRAPFVIGKSESAFSRTATMFDTSIGWRFTNAALESVFGAEGMGSTAENLAELYTIGREEQDAFAYHSQQKASAAEKAGHFLNEIVPVEISRRKAPSHTFERDEFIRHDTSLEKMATLKPAFRFDGKGSVTAANSSGINDGACALLVLSGDAVKTARVDPMVRIVSSAVVGVEPRIMGIGPVESSKRALAAAGLSIEQMDVIELNEAFAAQSIACLRELGLSADDERLNPNGGAIALGHPLGMSGARLLLTAAHQLKRTGGRYALCTMCVGVGQGMATIIERA
ncbi:MAG: acetyl-CoA C-acyltransferase [Rhodothermales bacterium]|nr:acetyl-CoA C-acyltransferase [Rhodothermales bacterium]